MVKNALLEMKEDEQAQANKSRRPLMILTLRLLRLIRRKQARRINLRLKANTGRLRRSLLGDTSALLLFVYAILMKSRSDSLLATVQFPTGIITI